MSSFQGRISNQQQFEYWPHTDVSGETWQIIKKGTCTSNGAADGTTIIDTNGDSGGSDTYNGLYWVHILSGTCTGAWARVVDDNGSGTLTLENTGFEAQIASGVEYEIWKSCEPVIVVDSSSGETDCVDAGRNDESDGFWVGYYVVPITGDRRGKIARITSYTQSSGTFVLASGLGGALAAGDVCKLRKFVEVGELSMALEEAFTQRPQKRVNFAMGDGVVGPRGGTVNFAAQAVASGSLSGNGVKAAGSALSQLYEACGLEEVVGTSCTVQSGSSSTAVKIATATGERLSLGMGVIWNGNMRFIDSIDDGGGSEDTVNVTPAFPGTPQANDILYATRMYKKTEDGDVRAIGIEVEQDGVRTTMTGCKGSLTFTEGVANGLQFQLNVDHWVRQVESAPYNPASAYTTAVVVKGSDKQCFLDSTAADMSPITASPNTVVQPRNVQGSGGINGRAGFQLTDIAPTLTYRQLMSSSGGLDADTRWLVRTAKKVSVVFGSHGNAIGFRIPVGRLMEVPNPVDENGLLATPNVVDAQDAGTGTSNLTTSKIPDFAISIS